MTAGDRRIEVRPDLQLTEGYHSPQVDVPVRLNTNEAPDAPPPEVVEAIAAAAADLQLNRYPDRRASALRESLAEHHGVEADQILLGNGSNEVLQAVCLAFGGPGRRSLVFEPTYAMHGHISRITGTEVVVGGRRSDWTLDLSEARRLWAEAEPAITFLCSPNNPTGTVEAADVVATAVDEAPGLVVVDEAYAQFSPHTALDLLGDDLPLVVSRTFSKTWAMAALRLGYLVGPRWVVEALEQVVLPYHVDALKQAAGVIALEHVDAMEARVAGVVEERGRLQVAMSDLGVEVFPSGANFLLFRPPDGSGHDVWERMLDHGVLVRDCSAWPGLEGCLRVTVGTRHEGDEFISALGNALGPRRPGLA